MDEKIQKFINILRELPLEKVESDLLEVNIKLMTQEDRFNVGLKAIGEEGIISLLQMVNYRLYILKFINDRVTLINGNPNCISIKTF